MCSGDISSSSETVEGAQALVWISAYLAAYILRRIISTRSQKCWDFLFLMKCEVQPLPAPAFFRSVFFLLKGSYRNLTEYALFTVEVSRPFVLSKSTF